MACLLCSVGNFCIPAYCPTSHFAQCFWSLCCRTRSNRARSNRQLADDVGHNCRQRVTAPRQACQAPQQLLQQMAPPRLQLRLLCLSRGQAAQSRHGNGSEFLSSLQTLHWQAPEQVPATTASWRSTTLTTITLVTTCRLPQRAQWTILCAAALLPNRWWPPQVCQSPAVQLQCFY